MRTLRTLMLVASALTLALSSTVAVVAQDDPSAPASFVGWVLDETHVDGGTEEDLGSILQRRDLAYSYRFEAADARMSGDGQWLGNGNRYRAEPLFELQTSTWIITNDGGTWEGSGHGLRGTGVGDSSTALLTGTGDYEGMSAYLVIEWALGGGSMRGAIFPGNVADTPSN